MAAAFFTSTSYTRAGSGRFGRGGVGRLSRIPRVTSGDHPSLPSEEEVRELVGRVVGRIADQIPAGSSSSPEVASPGAVAVMVPKLAKRPTSG